MTDFRKSIAFIVGHESVANNKIELQGDQHAHCTLDRLFTDHLSEVHLSVDQILQHQNIKT